jgi:hypothetical protein
MSELAPRSARNGATAMGVMLIAIGAIGYAVTQTGLDLDDWMGGSGWTLLVLGPGVLLLGGALLTERASALGFTIAGSIVITVGLLLLYMDRTGHWESWAYAWTIIPAAAGVALLAHGVRSGSSRLVSGGARLIGIGVLMLVLGWWFFEAIFQTGRAPLDLGTTWPVALVALGGLIVILGFVSSRHQRPLSGG